MAVIHPSPRKLKKPIVPATPDMTIEANSASLNFRKYEGKQLPDHLIRPPADAFAQSSSPKKAGYLGAAAKKGSKLSKQDKAELATK